MLSYMRSAVGVACRRLNGSTDCDICAICQDSLDVPAEIVRMPGCTHVFHGCCLVQHLMHSQRCPICRSSLGSDDDEAAVSTEHVPRRVTVQEAIHSAQVDENATSRTMRSLQTIRKWSKTVDKLARDYWRLRRVIRSRHREAMKCAERDFKANNKDLAAERSKLRKQLNYARTQRNAARQRLATNYGYAREL